MLGVDFDEDGDADLLFADFPDGNQRHFRFSRYFEHVSGELVERTEDENPLKRLGGVHWIADVDGDGRPEMLTTGWLESGAHYSKTRLGCVRRSGDGSLVPMPENPFAGITIAQGEGYQFRVFVTDWNSDGLPDFLVLHFWSVRATWEVVRHFQHVLDLDIKRNTQIDTYEDIQLQYREPIVVDWNQDGFEDVVVLRWTSDFGGIRAKHLHLHEYLGQTVREAEGFFENVTESLQGRNKGVRATMVDWDQDGDLDLLISSEADGKLHYHEMVSGTLQKELPHHPFSEITVKYWSRGNSFYEIQPLVVDWDQDGDYDLFLGPPDGRYFEQLTDGTLREWPVEQSPVYSVMQLATGYSDRDISWKFVDCDEDGDLDLLRLRSESADHQLQACEHGHLHELRCDDDFQCLGTNLSRFHNKPGGPMEGLGKISFFDVGNVSDGRLKLLVSHQNNKGAVFWSAGFCVPVDPCYKKGMCLPRRTHCSCIAGRELSDCSGCEANFYSVQVKEGEMHDCQTCPGEGGLVCYGRGKCFDDATAKALPLESTAASMVTGNGSCSCHEVHFYGSDDEGRSTCGTGVCPAGTQEEDGRCRLCTAGSFSPEGGVCKICFPGTFSLAGSSKCLKCSPGTVSKESGASACDACPAGTYEVDSQVCSVCPSGTISNGGSGTCSQCEAGRFARDFLTCELCPAGTWSRSGSSECQRCLPGTFSLGGSSNCSTCSPGTVSTASAVACDVCPAGTYEANHQLCSVCPLGTISTGGTGTCSQCEAGRFARSSLTCEPCPGGTFAGEGSSACQTCPVDHVSSPNSAACQSCRSFLIRANPDAKKQSCQVRAMDIVFALVCWLVSACFYFLLLTGFSGRIPISDVSAQGQKLVVTTSMAHFLLERACPVVTFTGTGVPDLSSASHTWKVKSLSLYQLTLHGESTMPLDTSTGHLHLKLPQVFLSAGLWRIPLLWWSLLFLAATAATASQLTWSLALVACGLGLCVGSLAFALRRRQGGGVQIEGLRTAWQGQMKDSTCLGVTMFFTSILSLHPFTSPVSRSVSFTA